MSAYGHALPLPRRRRRRKPTPFERMAIGCFCWQVLLVLGATTFNAIAASAPWGAIQAAVGALVIRFTSWPTVWNYIVNGWEDD